MVSVSIVDGPLSPWTPTDARADVGAEIVFHGRVRAGEKGRDIRALYYEHYAGMAEKELGALAEEIASAHGLLDLTCDHRVGEIAVGDVSLRVVIRAAHRQEGIEALDAFIVELKQRVPIWKWGVTPDGERFPS